MPSYQCNLPEAKSRISKKKMWDSVKEKQDSSKFWTKIKTLPLKKGQLVGMHISSS